MNITQDLAGRSSIFIDTAPIIYYIEANPEFGEISKNIISFCLKENIQIYTSVLTLSEVLPNPVQLKKNDLVKKFTQFLDASSNVQLINISKEIALNAGSLRGKYPALKTIDAIQISAALTNGIDLFLTNDIRLRQVSEIDIIILKDYVSKT